jgi:FlaA1/EpsC-like NDP-sugar epimerase
MAIKSRPSIRNRYLLAGDIILIVASVLGAYSLRFELGAEFFFYFPSAIWMIGVALCVKPLVYYFYGFYRRMWSYASVQELRIIVVGVTTSSVLVSVIMVILLSSGVFIGFPRSVLIIDWVISLLMAGGIRFTVRLLAESQVSTSNADLSRLPKVRKVLVVGAGDAGALVVREMQKNPQINMVCVGFLDDDTAKQNQQLYGIPVVGTITDLSRVLDEMAITEVIIAVPSAPGRVVRLVADVCRLKGIPFRTMPGIYELLGGKVGINRLREVDITDLIRREPVRIRDENIGLALKNKTVLVTGAGGSIGRELCRQIARWTPSTLIMLGHGENSIFEAMLELQELYPSLPLRPVIADVRDVERMKTIFSTYRPHVVFHAAAHKHVPLMEFNIEEAVTNNILGTRNTVDAAMLSGVERFVMVSTDKAIRPINVMGATKRVAEMIVLDAARRSGKAYEVVRFGNVLGSRGSVVPLFKRQIAHGGPVTVTHPDMRRYFMTIPEAVYLVLQAGSFGMGGETFVLNMGEQIRIMDLVEDLIRLSGLEPGRDIEIIFTGIRPGEKLSEDLWDESHQLLPTAHPDVFTLDGQERLSGGALAQAVDQLAIMANTGDGTGIVSLFDQLIAGAAVRSQAPPDITAVD